MFKHFGTSGTCTIIYLSHEDAHKPEQLIHRQNKMSTISAMTVVSTNKLPT